MTFKIVWDFLMCHTWPNKRIGNFAHQWRSFSGRRWNGTWPCTLQSHTATTGACSIPGGSWLSHGTKKNGKDKTNVNLWGTLCVCNISLCFGSSLLECWGSWNVITFEYLSKTSSEKPRSWLPATYSQHLSLQKGPVLHAAGGVHMKQLTFDGGRVAWGHKQKSNHLSKARATVKFLEILSFTKAAYVNFWEQRWALT